MEAFDELYGLVQQAGILGSVQELLGWDQEVIMVEGEAPLRTRQMATLSAVAHERAIDSRIGELLTRLEAADIPADQASFVREVAFTYHRQKRVPAELVERITAEAVQGVEAWRIAREKDDFSAFAPYLERLIALKREYAAAINPDKPAYQVLLEDFEPGLTLDEVRSFLVDIKEGLAPLLKSLRQVPSPNDSFKQVPIAVEKQMRFNHFLAGYLGYDFKKGRLDLSTHPFTGAHGRITTRFSDGWVSAILSTAHEAGHGMYEHDLPVEHVGTPWGEARSLTVHESQSRFWENCVVRSLPFWKGLFPKFQNEYFEAVSALGIEQFVQAVCKVQPGFIRVDADEVTYPLHIILRFELEQALIDGSLAVADLPSAWNNKMQELLGIVPPNNRLGCLQDIHWSWGEFGYFSTYALGSMLSAQLFAAMRRDISDLDAKVATGEFRPLAAWLDEKVHCHAKRLELKCLVREATGKELAPDDYVAYLTKKYSLLYGLL